jgi:hypothetical protein
MILSPAATENYRPALLSERTPQNNKLGLSMEIILYICILSHIVISLATLKSLQLLHVSA